MKGKLFLIPTPVYENTIDIVLPIIYPELLNSVDYFIVENIRSARRFLISAKISRSINELNFFVLNKHTKKSELSGFLDPVINGFNVGLLSEAGLPCIADPGAEIVSIAHSKNITVVPLSGPSSIFLALMASGLNGQNFSFIGYLPIKRQEKINMIRLIEKRSLNENQTQIFIETPYRNNQLLHDLLQTCSPDTQLCIASEITSPHESIVTKAIKDWKNTIPDLSKKPTIFLIQKILKYC